MFYIIKIIHLIFHFLYIVFYIFLFIQKTEKIYKNMYLKHKCNRRNLKNFVVRVGLEPVSNWGKKSTPRAYQLSCEFAWLLALQI